MVQTVHLSRGSGWWIFAGGPAPLRDPPIEAREITVAPPRLSTQTPLGQHLSAPFRPSVRGTHLRRRQLQRRAHHPDNRAPRPAHLGRGAPGGRFRTRVGHHKGTTQGHNGPKRRRSRWLVTVTAGFIYGDTCAQPAPFGFRVDGTATVEAESQCKIKIAVDADIFDSNPNVVGVADTKYPRARGQTPRSSAAPWAPRSALGVPGSCAADHELDRRLQHTPPARPPSRRRAWSPPRGAGVPASMSGMTWGSSAAAWARPVKKRMPSVYRRPSGIGVSPPA